MRLILMLCLLLGSSLSWATLGGAPSGFASQRATQATSAAQTPAGASYQIVRTTLNTQTAVAEYVDASGQVFAVSWSGPFQPDLQELLGASFSKLSAGRTRPQVQDDTAHVETSGHMGAFRGRAWLPAQLPAGFDPQQIP